MEKACAPSSGPRQPDAALAAGSSVALGRWRGVELLRIVRPPGIVTTPVIVRGMRLSWHLGVARVDVIVKIHVIVMLHVILGAHVIVWDHLIVRTHSFKVNFSK